MKQAVMKCPKCRYGMVYRYKNGTLKCERCGETNFPFQEKVKVPDEVA